MSLSQQSRARFVVASDQSLLVYFDQNGESKAHSKSPPSQNRPAIEPYELVRRFVRLLELDPIAGVRNLHPAYSSVLVKFDALRLGHEDLEKLLSAHIERMDKVPLPEPRHVEIPVCYGGEFGPDLRDVADLHKFSPERVIELHSAPQYIVYFLGFVPGFAYLGELPQELATPRLAMPRKRVPAGSVGIARNQTGIYPVSTPGGWRLLGRTPAAMFRPERKEMSLLSIGDRVRFAPISREQFAKWENL